MRTRKHVADVFQALEDKANADGYSLADVLVHSAKSMGVQIVVTDDDRYEIDPAEQAIREADAEANAEAEAAKATARAEAALADAKHWQEVADAAKAKAADLNKPVQIDPASDPALVNKDVVNA